MEPMQEIPDHNGVIVAAMYHFVRVADPASEQEKLRQLCDKAGIKGTLLLASEGINGTVCGSRDAITTLIAYIRAHPLFAPMVVKYSKADEDVFFRLKVRLKREIVTMGVPDTDPNHIVGTYVAPKEWNKLLDDPDVLVVDTRNAYEFAIGSFDGAVDPQTETFREFPQWARQLAAQEEEKRPKKLAMFCTGGIRCEKATSYMKQLGFDEVYHLQGGILKYLEEIPAEDSKWHGECFVFDHRVSVRHGLEPGNYDMCHACRLPLGEEELDHPAYVEGVSCPHCIDKLPDEDKARFAERQKQMELARQRGEQHIGGGQARKR